MELINSENFLNVLLMGEALIVLSAIPHFFIRRLPVKVILFCFIIFSFVWILFCVSCRNQW